MKYGYARVLTDDQSTALQLAAFAVIYGVGQVGGADNTEATQLQHAPAFFRPELQTDGL